jgi:cell fate regulator YaaT (PSP1 superfamily)
MKLAAITLSERSFPKYYDLNDVELRPGDICLVEDKQLTEALGRVAMIESRSSHQVRGNSYPRVLRLADEKEVEQWGRLDQREVEAISMGKEKARALKLDMKISSVRFDDRQRRVIYNFTADQRIDFRQLVRELASALHARIELWQIGVRDESGRLCGLGICGKELCCGAWIKEFRPVSIRQAKDQDLLLSPAKLSGVCGRLRCCLAYEHAHYKECQKNAPAVGAVCQTSEHGEVVVLERSLLRAQAGVADKNGELHVIDFSDIDKVTGKLTPSQLKLQPSARILGRSPSTAPRPAATPEPPALPAVTEDTEATEATAAREEKPDAQVVRAKDRLEVRPESEDEAKASASKRSQRRRRRPRARDVSEKAPAAEGTAKTSAKAAQKRIGQAKSSAKPQPKASEGGEQPKQRSRRRGRRGRPRGDQKTE